MGADKERDKPAPLAETAGVPMCNSCTCCLRKSFKSAAVPSVAQPKLDLPPSELLKQINIKA